VRAVEKDKHRVSWTEFFSRMPTPCAPRRNMQANVPAVCMFFCVEVVCVPSRRTNTVCLGPSSFRGCRRLARREETCKPLFRKTRELQVCDPKAVKQCARRVRWSLITSTLLLEATWSLLDRWHHHHGRSKQPCSTKIEELHAKKGGHEKKQTNSLAKEDMKRSRLTA
jgi:hypothetical protein